MVMVLAFESKSGWSAWDDSFNSLNNNNKRVSHPLLKLQKTLFFVNKQNKYQIVAALPCQIHTDLREEGRKADTPTDNQLEGSERPRKKSPSLCRLPAIPFAPMRKVFGSINLTSSRMREREEEENELRYGLGKDARRSSVLLPLHSLIYLFLLSKPYLKRLLVFCPIPFFTYHRYTSTQSHRPTGPQAHRRRCHARSSLLSFRSPAGQSLFPFTAFFPLPLPILHFSLPLLQSYSPSKIRGTCIFFYPFPATKKNHYPFLVPYPHPSQLGRDKQGRQQGENWLLLFCVL